MPSYTKAFVRTHRIGAAQLGVNGETLDTDATSSAFAFDGFNQLKIRCTRVNNSGTATTFYFQTSEDGGTTWDRRMSGSVSSGTETLSPHLASAAIATLTFDYYLPIIGMPGDLMRVVFPNTSDAADTITASVTLGVV